MTAIARENLEDRLADRLSAPALRVPVFHEVCVPTAGQLQALLTRITERLMKLIIDTQHCHASDAFHGWQSGTERVRGREERRMGRGPGQITVLMPLNIRRLMRGRWFNSSKSRATNWLILWQSGSGRTPALAG